MLVVPSSLWLFLFYSFVFNAFVDRKTWVTITVFEMLFSWHNCSFISKVTSLSFYCKRMIATSELDFIQSTYSISATLTEPEEGEREKICVSVSFTAQINFLKDGQLSDGQQRCTREREMGKRGIIQNHFTSPHGGSNIKKVWWFSTQVFIPGTSAITGLKQWWGTP